MVLEPGLDAHTAQALGDELQFAVLAAGVVDLDQRAVFGKGASVEVARVFLGRVHEEQGQGVVFGFADQFEGFGPRLFVDDDRQDLGREERTVVDRDDVDLVRQVLPGQRQAGAGGGVFDVVGFVVVVVVRAILLVGHGAPAQWGMGLRWGRVWVVSMGGGVSTCVFRVLTGFTLLTWRPLGRPGSWGLGVYPCFGCCAYGLLRCTSSLCLAAPNGRCAPTPGSIPPLSLPTSPVDQDQEPAS